MGSVQEGVSQRMQKRVIFFIKGMDVFVFCIPPDKKYGETPFNWIKI